MLSTEQGFFETQTDSCFAMEWVISIYNFRKWSEFDTEAIITTTSIGVEMPLPPNDEKDSEEHTVRQKN